MFNLDFPLTKARLMAGLSSNSAYEFQTVACRLRASPPAHLRLLHAPQLANGIWEQLQSHLARPVKTVILDNGARAVEVLGTAVFMCGRSGQLHPFLYEGTGELICHGSEWVMVTEIPYGTAWLDRLTLNLVKARCEGPEYLVEAYAKCLAKAAKRQLSSAVDMRKVRSQVAEALALDDDAWRLCHRLKVGSPLENKASLWQYNICLRNKAALLEFERVAPGALGIYAVLCERHDFPSQGEPTQRLKRFLADAGLNASTWSLVLNSGTSILNLVRQFYRGPWSYAVVDALQVMQGLGIAKALPVWLSQAIFADWGHAGARRESYFKLLRPSLGNLRHLVVCVQQLHEKPNEQLEEQVVKVVHWLNEPERRALTRTQRQGGWDYLVREANAFHRLREERAKARGVTWQVPFESLDTGSLRLVAISTGVQLLEEGRSMRNCAADLTRACADGALLLVSVFQPDARHIATASYRVLEDKWVLFEAKGPTNRSLPLGIMEKLRQAAARFPAPDEMTATAIEAQAAQLVSSTITTLNPS